MNISCILVLFCVYLRCSLSQKDFHKYRLPKEVIPLSYSLKFKPDLDKGSFKGETFIKIRVFEPVTTIYLHGNNLNISNVEIVGDLQKVRFGFEEKYDLIKVHYENEEEILPDDYLLYFEYNGSLLHIEQMGMIKGMYSFKNRTEVLMVTDFQPTYARRAFPCFDEPAIKAIFNITIITPDSSWIALSNTEEIDRQVTSDGVVYKFESSPRMSTDLTSFAVTKMDFIENIYEKTNGKMLKIRTFLPNAKEENQTFVLNFAFEVIKYLENFTQIPYPMSKIDFIEYDKKFTATEYWGLTTFKSGLLNPSLNLYDTRQISIIVAHELTHYWFGNLVTNKWWSDIWLHEGFAQYLSHKIVDEILNTTNVEEYPLDYTGEVFKEDREVESVHPVVSNCTTPEEIMIQFNDITYVKAGSLIRFLNYLTGDEGFEKILRKYLKLYEFNSASTENFIAVVEDVFPNRNLREFMETWLLQNRYPMLNIEENSEKNVYVITQQSASKFQENDTMSPYGYTWTIPVIYTTDTNEKPTTVWFGKNDAFITIPKGKESFIKLNYNFMGLYFTNYTSSMWNNLIENVQLLSGIEQAQLALESYRLFEADLINCDISLKFVARVSSKPNQYGTSPISILYTLRDKLEFDQLAIEMLRKFYYNLRAKSKVNRKHDFETKQLLKKIIKRNTFSSSNDVVKMEVPEEKPHPRYVKCSKWIHENLNYLI